MIRDLSNFEKDGFIILRNFIKDENFNSLCEKVKKEVLLEFNKLKKTGGSLMGNLNISPGVYSKKNLSAFDIISGGNLNFQYKYNQHFHTDSKFENSFLIVNVVTEDIYESNGPLEVLPGTQKERLPYWKIIFKKGLRIFAKKGDLIIRTSNLWHRGTKNISRNPRLLLAYTFQERKGENGKLEFEKNKDLKILNNLFKSNIKGILKENFYTRFSYLYKSFRLLRSIFTNKHFH